MLPLPVNGGDSGPLWVETFRARRRL